MIIDKLLQIFTQFDKEYKIFNNNINAIEGIVKLVSGINSCQTRKTMKQLFEDADLLISRQSFVKNIYIQKGYNKRTIIFQNCDVTYKRRKYSIKKEYRKNGDKSTIFLLDKYLGLQSYQRLDFEFQINILKELGDTSSYSKIASTFNNSGISKQVVRNLINKFEIKNLDNIIFQEPENKLKHDGIIYVENDDAFRKTLNTAKEAKQKCFTLSVIHTGYVDDNAKRKTMANRRILLTMRDENAKSNNKKYWSAVKDFVYMNYENPEKAKIYIIGDGANKIQICEKYNDWTFILDRFHVVKKIKDSVLGNREYKRKMSKMMSKAIKNQNFEWFYFLLQTAKLNCKNDSNKIEKLIELENYINNNIEFIKRWSLKDYIGCRIESYISSFVKVAFRSRPKIFSDKTIHKIFLIKQLIANGINPFDEIKEQETQRSEEQFIKYRYRVIESTKHKKSELPKIAIPILDNYKETPAAKYFKSVMYNYSA